MPRSLRTLVAVLLALVPVGAQAQTLFSEDFDGVPGPTAGGAGTYAFPSGWTLLNVDNRTPDAQVAYVNAAWERREDFVFNVADSAMFSTSWYAPAGAADDWAITPPIVLPAAATIELRWNAVTYDASYPDGYEVYVSTGDATVAACQANPRLVQVAAENAAWTARMASLDAYAGQTVRVCFRNNSFDKFLLLIDDIVVQNTTLPDLSLVRIERPSEYRQVPVNPAPMPLTLGGTLHNTSGSPLSDVRLTATVERDGAEAHVATSTGATVAAGDSLVVSLPAFTPTQLGTYRVRYRASFDGTDDAPANDTLSTFTVAVTDSTLARDSGVFTSTLGIGAGNGGTLGQTFTLGDNGAFYGVTAFMQPTGGQFGDTLYAVLYTTTSDGSPARAPFTSARTASLHEALTGGAPAPATRRSTDRDRFEWTASASAAVADVPSTLVARSAPVVITAADTAGVMQPYRFDFEPQYVTGTFFVGVEEDAGTMALGTDPSGFVPETAYVIWPTIPGGTWRPVETFGFSVAFGLRPIFSPTGELPVELTSFTAAANGPGRVVLQWETASETANAGFSVELARGDAWTPIASVPGHGTTAERHVYAHTATGLAAGRQRFRLRQTDLDGTTVVVGTVEAVVTADGGLSLSAPRPQPVRGAASFVLGVSGAQTVTVEVLDLLGRRIALLADGVSVDAGAPLTVDFDGASVAPGVYVVRARTTQTSVQQRIVVAR